jgi:hypothetical protein
MFNQKNKNRTCSHESEKYCVKLDMHIYALIVRTCSHANQHKIGIGLSEPSGVYSFIFGFKSTRENIALQSKVN